MRFRAHIVPSTLLALVLLASVAGPAAAQLCPQTPTGGNRLVSTSPSLRTTTGGWYGSLLTGAWTKASFRLPERVAVTTSRVVPKRVGR